MYRGGILFWFEAASSMTINLDQSQLVPVRGVPMWRISDPFGALDGLASCLLLRPPFESPI